MKASTTPTCSCPTCGYKLDRASAAYGPHEDPQPGDISCCICCGEVLVFDEKLAPRLPTLDDAMTWSTALFKQVVELQRAIRRERPVSKQVKHTYASKR